MRLFLQLPVFCDVMRPSPKFPLPYQLLVGILYKNTGANMESSRRKLLGDRLRAARRRVGASQVQISQDLGVTRQSISSWENGVSAPSATQLAQLSVAYCVCAHTLLFGEPFKPVDVSRLVQGRQGVEK